MKIRRTDAFIKQTARLLKGDPRLGNAIAECLERLVTSPRPPGLRVKRLQSLAGKWETRVNRNIRIIFSLEEDGILLEAIGSHDDVLP